jgi:hypothetical protein
VGTQAAGPSARHRFGGLSRGAPACGLRAGAPKRAPASFWIRTPSLNTTAIESCGHRAIARSPAWRERSVLCALKPASSTILCMATPRITMA